MGLFDFFKEKKKKKQAEAAEKWNLMWKMWAKGLMPSPRAEVMTYYSEVMNGGHGQYFANVENNGDLKKEMAALAKVLPGKFMQNLHTAYRAHQVPETDVRKKEAADAMEWCDMIFYENEQELICIMESFAASLKVYEPGDRKTRKLVAEAIQRITRMEAVYDALRADPSRTDLRQKLKAYYEGNQWRWDYQLDEAGLLPADLKRGVLSQDGVYDLLSETEK